MIKHKRADDTSKVIKGIIDTRLSSTQAFVYNRFLEGNRRPRLTVDGAV